MSATHVLYRFYSATGQLLYVGITMNPAQRFNNHRDSKDWWSDVAGISIENYGSREDLANAERRAIQVERPLHNVVHTKRKKHKWTNPPAQPVPESGLDDEPMDLAPTAASLMHSLFGRDGHRDTPWGYLSEDKYQERLAYERAKQAKVDACPFCDPMGYRGTWLCNHVDNGGPTLNDALRQARKDLLVVIDGGPGADG